MVDCSSLPQVLSLEPGGPESTTPKYDTVCRRWESITLLLPHIFQWTAGEYHTVLGEYHTVLGEYHIYMHLKIESA